MKFILLSFFVFLSYFTNGQEFQLSTDNPTELAIDGTSTLHGWTATAGEVAGVPSSINIQEDQLNIDSFSIVTQVMSLDGGRGPAMNSKIQKALQVETHPEVIFTADELIIPVSDTEGDTFTLSGQLNIAGKTESVEFDTNVVIEDGSVDISGSQDFKMSTFDIAAPTAMFGQIKTKDEITIRFSVHYILK